MVYSKVLMKDKATGLKYLKEMLLPIPAFEIGDRVGYGEDPDDRKFCIESEITGYDIEVTVVTNKAGNREIRINIGYHMINGDMILEEEIEQYYNPNTKEYTDAQAIVAEMEDND